MQHESCCKTHKLQATTQQLHGNTKRKICKNTRRKIILKKLKVRKLHVHVCTHTCTTCTHMFISYFSFLLHIYFCHITFSLSSLL